MIPGIANPAFFIPRNTSSFPLRLSPGIIKTNITWTNVRRVILINESIKLVFLAVLIGFVAFLCIRECEAHKKVWFWLTNRRVRQPSREPTLDQRWAIVSHTDTQQRTSERAAGDIA
ncbi:hypothetical protein TNCV_5133871 [Trichonephila clavipes]|nr:hypothetical protein TNCV_5133871 [Trichonephila clavipes]